MTKGNIPFRGMDLKPRIDYNVVGHQEPPMIPKAPSNEQQRQIVRKAASLMLAPSTPEQRSKGGKAKKRKHTPHNGHFKPGEKCNEDTNALRIERLKEHHAKRRLDHARTLFRNGPMTSSAICAVMGHTKAVYTTVILRSWAKAGIVRIVGTKGRENIWGLCDGLVA